MISNPIFILGVRRFVFLFLLSMGFIWAISEGAYYLQRDTFDRAPSTIELLIPSGTAERVAEGEPVPAIPDHLAFVVGDTLVVRNEDIQAHQLGPLWIPPGTSASLTMEQPDKYTYSCSFQTTRYLGIDVLPPTTWATRLTALAMATPATAIILFVYSILIWPLQPKKSKSIQTGLQSEE